MAFIQSTAILAQARTSQYLIAPPLRPDPCTTLFPLDRIINPNSEPTPGLSNSRYLMWLGYKASSVRGFLAMEEVHDADGWIAFRYVDDTPRECLASRIPRHAL